MSICKLRGINVKIFWRQAFLLAHPRPLIPPGGYIRGKHNSLYQMVKKRTLEARTKLQPNKFPNNQPCISQSKSTNTTLSPPSTSSSNPPAAAASTSATVHSSNTPCPPSPPPPPFPPIPKPSTAPSCPAPAENPAKLFNPATSSCKPPAPDNPPCPPKKEETNKCEKPKPKPCHNSQVLTSHCSTKAKPCGGGDDNTCGDKKPPCDESDGSNNTKLLIGLLAALGAGGLIWLLTKGKSKDSDCTKTTPASAPATVPSSSSDLPKHVPYLLIGGGTASFSAFRAIKSNDAKAKVLMVTNEHRKPYMRPPLSKELWYSAKQVELTKDYRFKQWTGAERSLFFEPEEFFIDPAKLLESANGGIAVAQGHTVRRIDPVRQVAILSDGYEIGYDTCLIATGCTPKSMDVFTEAPQSVREKVMVYRTPEDFERLKRYADEKKSITIIGNGFTGSELACSLVSYAKDKNVKIYQVFPEEGVMSRVLPNYLSQWTTQKVQEQGVCVVANAGIKSAQRDESLLKVTLSTGNTLLTDVVVMCVGCEANTSIAHLSGLEVHRKLGGFVVNAELEARTNLYAAGDVACFYDPMLGRRRVEHHDHSVVSGRLAGENMAGNKKAYTHQSMFWSDLGPEIGYEGIGLVDSSLPTVAVFAAPGKSERNSDHLTEKRTEGEDSPSLTAKDSSDIKCDDKDAENYGRGVIFYLKDDKIVGILLWNLFNRIGLARTIINQNKQFNDLNEVAKLFEIHA